MDIKGQLDIECELCGMPYAWARKWFKRPDGYRDWYLEIYCGCGICMDTGIEIKAYEQYHLQIRREIWREQDEILDSALGIEMHDLIKAKISGVMQACERILNDQADCNG